MMTLMTNRKSPKVTRVSGRVKIMSNGLMIKLSTANTSAKMIAVVIECMATFGDNNFERINTTTAVITIFIISLIQSIFSLTLYDYFGNKLYCRFGKIKFSVLLRKKNLTEKVLYPCF